MRNSIKMKVRECQDIFGYDNVLVYSNSLGYSRKTSELDCEIFENKYKIKVVRHDERKPDDFKNLSIDLSVKFKSNG